MKKKHTKQIHLSCTTNNAPKQRSSNEPNNNKKKRTSLTELICISGVVCVTNTVCVYKLKQKKKQQTTQHPKSPAYTVHLCMKIYWNEQQNKVFCLQLCFERQRERDRLRKTKSGMYFLFFEKTRRKQFCCSRFWIFMRFVSSFTSGNLFLLTVTISMWCIFVHDNIRWCFCFSKMCARKPLLCTNLDARISGCW